MGSPFGLISCQTGAESPARDKSGQTGAGSPACDNSAQGHTLERSRESSMSPVRNPIHMLRRVFRTQEEDTLTQEDDTLPAMTTSDSLFSLSSDSSSSRSSMSDLLRFAATERALKVTPR